MSLRVKMRVKDGKYFFVASQAHLVLTGICNNLYIHESTVAEQNPNVCK